MSRKLLLVLLLATGVALADEAPAEKRPEGAAAEEAKKKEEKAKAAEAKAGEQPNVKEDDPDLGMSILGNQEAPKSLVIVPWKRSEIGDSMGISTMLDDSRQPIDKEVFMRILNYYEVRSTTTRIDGAPAGSGTAKPTAAAHGRKS